MKPSMLLAEAPDMTIEDWRDAREFCLGEIKRVYSIDYTPEWHADLDAMLTPENVYAPENGGWFIFVRDETGQVIACAGLRSLATRPNLAERFVSRWPDATEVGALWRSYVAASYRGKGIGTMMKRRRVEKARELGYEALYLHASGAQAVRFGTTFGFEPFTTDPDGTVHMALNLS